MKIRRFFGDQILAFIGWILYVVCWVSDEVNERRKR